MLFQASLSLHKILNEELLSFESVTVLNQMTCTRRQTVFKIPRDNKNKIGMNTTAKKYYCKSGKISLLSLNYGFVHFKKAMKIQFLKYETT